MTHAIPPQTLREALAIVLEEGLETRFERHRQMHLRLSAGLNELGISYIPQFGQ